MNNKYILNPYYILRKDVKRIIILDNGSTKIPAQYSSDFVELMHPMHAMMLSFFKGDKTLFENIQEICDFFLISREKAISLLKELIENKDDTIIQYDGNLFAFPKHTLVKNDAKFPARTYSPGDFLINEPLDLNTVRLYIPTQMTIMLNTICQTDCIYCYANKNVVMDCKIPTSKIIELIDDAKKLDFVNVDLAGGEIFMHKDWALIIKHLYSSGFDPYLSTKIPLSSSQIQTLKELGVKEIQISFDSIYSEDLEKNIKRGETYLEKMKVTLNELERNGFDVKIKGVITAHIYDIDKTRAYIDYFGKFNNIKSIELTPAGYSLYKTQEQYLSFRLSMNQVDELLKLVDEVRSLYKFSIRVDNSYSEKKDVDIPADKKANKFNTRAKCTGNTESFFILPDGQVTVCEEAQWLEPLIIGDILENSIMDVWMSEKALGLYNLDQKRISPQSACSTCKDFSDCRTNEGVCWIDIIAAYGKNNWDYPDPGCPLSPELQIVNYYE